MKKMNAQEKLLMAQRALEKQKKKEKRVLNPKVHKGIEELTRIV